MRLTVYLCVSVQVKAMLSCSQWHRLACCCSLAASSWRCGGQSRSASRSVWTRPYGPPTPFQPGPSTFRQVGQAGSCLLVRCCFKRIFSPPTLFLTVLLCNFCSSSSLSFYFSFSSLSTSPSPFVNSSCPSDHSGCLQVSGRTRVWA